jgi:peptide/nickel transport system permease protein
VVRRHHHVSRAEARRRAIELLRRVDLPESEVVAERLPHELSGGMAQRVALAAALAGEPKLLIADEPTTALDVTVQAEILELIRELERTTGMAVLLITHDSGVIAEICDHVVVMYAGEVVERGETVDVFRQPIHPYTEALLWANPHRFVEGERLPAIPGSVPDPGAWPSGCRFHPRCSHATVECASAAITLTQARGRHETRCIHHDQLYTGGDGRSSPARIAPRLPTVLRTSTSVVDERDSTGHPGRARATLSGPARPGDEWSDHRTPKA